MSTIKLLWDASKELCTALFTPFKSLIDGVRTSLGSVFKFRSDEVKRPLLVLVSIIVIVVSLVSIYLSMRTPAPRINFKPFEALGEVTARETVKLIGDRGRVVVLTYDTGKVKSPVFEVQLDMFKSTLKKESKIEVEAVESVAMNQAMMDPMGGLTGADFVRILKQYPHVDAIISFLGAPYMKEADFHALPRRRPKIVAAMGYSPQLGELMKEDIVQVAITPRFQPPENATQEPQTRQEWFDRFYTVVGRDTLDKLPDFLRGPAAK